MKFLSDTDDKVSYPSTSTFLSGVTSINISNCSFLICWHNHASSRIHGYLDISWVIEIIFNFSELCGKINDFVVFDLSWINHDTDFTSCLKTEAICTASSHWRFLQNHGDAWWLSKRLATSTWTRCTQGVCAATITGQRFQKLHIAVVASNGIHHNCDCSLAEPAASSALAPALQPRGQ